MSKLLLFYPLLQLPETPAKNDNAYPGVFVLWKTIKIDGTKPLEQFTLVRAPAAMQDDKVHLAHYLRDGWGLYPDKVPAPRYVLRHDPYDVLCEALRERQNPNQLLQRPIEELRRIFTYEPHSSLSAQSRDIVF